MRENIQVISVATAKSLIKKQFGSTRRGGNQYLDCTRVTARARLLALEGNCGKCRDVITEKNKKGNRTHVIVRCRSGHSPVELHRPKAVDIVAHAGTQPSCGDFSPKVRV